MSADGESHAWDRVSGVVHWALGGATLGMTAGEWWTTHVPPRPDHAVTRANHIAAAFHHRFINRDQVMARMIAQLGASVRGSTTGSREGVSASLFS